MILEREKRSTGPKLVEQARSESFVEKIGSKRGEGVRSRSFGWQKSIGSIAAVIGGVTFGKPGIASTTGDLARRKPLFPHY
jgi:hypothetical protein